MKLFVRAELHMWVESQLSESPHRGEDGSSAVRLHCDTSADGFTSDEYM